MHDSPADAPGRSTNSLGQPTDVTSLSLLERVREHDPHAWERLLNLYGPLAAAWCRRAGLSDSDTDDVLQDVFAAVARSVEDFRHDRGSDTFRGWLRVIVRNRIRQHFRQLGTRPHATGGTTANQAIQSVPEDPLPDDPSVEAIEIRALLQRGLAIVRADFEPHTWQAFWQVVVDGKATTDVADELKMSPGAVRQAKYKVLRRLRAELGELMELPS